MNNLNGDFRETELGALPAEWKITALGELLDRKVLLARNGFPCGNHNDKGIGIPHLRPFNIDNSGRIALNTIKYIQTNADVTKYFLEQGDVIFNNTNSEELVGKTGYWQAQVKFVLSNHMTILRILQDGIIDGLYLSKFLQKRWEDGYFTGICRRHVNQASISLARLNQIAVALPPLPEQRAIARVLSTIQRAIETQDKLIAAARELKKSLMRQLFMQGLDANGAVKETEIGVMPEHWEIMKIGEIVTRGNGSIQTGPFGSLLHASDYVQDGIPFIMPKDLSSSGKILTESVARIGSNDYVRLSRYHLVEGDLLVGRRGEIGRRGLVTANESGWVCGSGCLRIRPGTLIDSHFLAHAFEANWLRDWLITNAIGTTMANLSAEIISRLPITLLPLAEQREIARILATVDKKIEAEEKRQAALQALFKTMLQKLMTGQIRVTNL